MIQTIDESHFTENGVPAGGETRAVGLEINWQNGPLGRGADRVEPNGCFFETVLQAAIGRLRYYQEASVMKKFACRENALAITKIEEALHWLNHRTAERERREVEGTHVA